MTRRRRTAGLWVVVFVSSFALGAAEDRSLRVEPEEIPRLTREICVLPLELDPALDLEHGAEMARRMRLTLARYLHRSGFDLRSLESVDRLREAALGALPDRYDRHTGSPTADRSAAREVAARERLARAGCSAFLSARVGRVRAPIANGVARWDGRAVMLLPRRYLGWVPALSLWIRVDGVDGQLAYFRASAIEVLASFDGSGLERRKRETVLREVPLLEAAILDAARPLVLQAPIYRERCGELRLNTLDACEAELLRSRRPGQDG